ncbi:MULTISPECIES: cupin domain-containing protein [Inquilinus]|uniref:Mannose-6-phosphate isomerase-like protein (Cupin superfamily) n=1 Tax=Inquilinus ginsengisoli TaxID=363840 RepID=A0ABU1JR16_9PROT|nr:cupin domain-containing protein [Inquilinus ginsengisoli]MDR6291066.1 mannose-6-phosphate isomerase-like protein (cupin superfamily) [Inquilinus ginsengisoli]
MNPAIDRKDWAEDPGRWHGEVQLGRHGAGISVIFFERDEPGGGPKLHRHPYPETFIIRSGRALFTLGAREILAEAGQIVVVPPNTPHKFTNPGPAPLHTIDIHENGTFITEWLE